MDEIEVLCVAIADGLHRPRGTRGCGRRDQQVHVIRHHDVRMDRQSVRPGGLPEILAIRPCGALKIDSLLLPRAMIWSGTPGAKYLGRRGITTACASRPAVDH